MPRRLRRLSGAEAAEILRRFGFQVVAQRGSHAKARRTLPDGSRQTLLIPMHRQLDPGTCRAIFRQASAYIPEDQLRPHFYTD